MADAVSSQGVRRITLIDADEVEAGNLDGMALVTGDSLGEPKVLALAEMLAMRFPSMAITGICGEFPALGQISILARADVLVTTTDADEPRLMAARLSRLLLQTHVDIGTSTEPWSGRSGADIRVCTPGSRCLVCLGGVASRENEGVRRPGTSTRLINATAAHLAVEMLAGVIARRRTPSRWVRVEAGGDGSISSRELPARTVAGVCPCCGAGAAGAEPALAVDEPLRT